MSRVANTYGAKNVPHQYNEAAQGTSSGVRGLQASPGVYIGIVKRNDDPQRMGRLQVYIEDFGGKPEDESTWISVSYASPFAGTTSIFEQGDNVTEYEDTIKSYGFWAIPPDIDARVLVGFAGGKIDEGYWFACLFQRGTTVSIPGIPAKNTWSGPNLPAAPKNKKDPDTDLDRFVEHKPLSNALRKQGLEEDSLRGLTSHSAHREAPSKVLGLLTPGQHQLVLDDGDAQGNSRMIRLRTRNGTQIMMDDVAGHIYLISKNGENWLELSADGHVHLYASGDVNVHSEKNINFYANQNINMEAGVSFNVKTNSGSINFQSANEFNSLAATNHKLTSGETSNINSGIGHYETAGVIHMNGPIADPADPIGTHILVVNQGIIESICNTVPEHEPWYGHSGSMNSSGHGNQQMQNDPAPDQQPRQPRPDEQGAPIVAAKEEAVPVKVLEATVTEPAKDKIKESNGYSPVNVDDGKGQSGGWASSLFKPANIGKAVTQAGKLLGLGAGAGYAGKAIEAALKIRDQQKKEILLSGGGIGGTGANFAQQPKTLDEQIYVAQVKDEFSEFQRTTGQSTYDRTILTVPKTNVDPKD